MTDPVDTIELLDAAPIEGVIFDMDGLLLDSETLAMEALADAARAMGEEMPGSFCRKMIGMPADSCRRLVRETYGEDFASERFFRLQEEILRDYVDQGRLTLKEGVKPLLDLLEIYAIPKAIATSSSRFRTDHHLKLVELHHRFQAIVTRDDVSRGKPNAEPYLAAAKAINIPVESCLALEDSPAGARAAQAAGIRVIIVPDLIHPPEDVSQRALGVVDSLTRVKSSLKRHFCKSEIV